MKVNKIYEGTVLELDYKADGVIKHNEYLIFVNGALKDEVVKYKVTKLKNNIGFAKLIEVLKKSKDRISETSNIGSLTLSHLSFHKQLSYQKEITKESFNKAFKAEFNVSDTITDNNYLNYRNKVVFHTLKRPNITLGLYDKYTNELIKVNNLIIANKYANELIKIINESNILIDPSKLKHITIRNNLENDLLVILNSYEKDFKGKNELIELIKTYKKTKGIIINIKKHHNKILGDESYLVYGDKYLYNKDLIISDKSFMQVNFNVMYQTFDLIKSHIYGNKIIDAYSGIGSIIYNVISNDMKAYSVENNLENIILSKIIKNNKKINNVEILKENSEDIIHKLNADTLIVDPPRKGLYKDLSINIKNSNFKRVIYLSCNLQTLIRDLKIINETYNIDKIYPIKMFPMTNSFETLVILTKK